MTKKVFIITEQGCRNLGQIIRQFRESPKPNSPLGWSLDEFVAEIQRETGFLLSKSTLSKLERGHSEPKWDTLAILAATGFILNSRTQQPFTTAELFAIACEQLDPIKGEYSVS